MPKYGTVSHVQQRQCETLELRFRQASSTTHCRFRPIRNRDQTEHEHWLHRQADRHMHCSSSPKQDNKKMIQECI